ncbi:sigma 54-interacting transcriptional regulator [Eubacteriales bacterium DFI.9.88]|nr:sigma 54-interacting transcriptional regulator [Eubacteriales bacterium DFI.9.88]
MIEKITDLNLLRFIVNNAACAIILIDKNENVIMTNLEYEKLTGYTDRYLTGMTVGDMIEKKIIHDSVSRKVMRQKQTVVLEQLSAGSSGSEYLVMVKGIPYWGQSKEIEYVICCLFDISDKRRIIEDLTASNLKYSMELLQLKKDAAANAGIVYRSPLMQTIIDKAEIIAKTDSTALILGESGTGKSMIARFLHDNSQRADNTFLTINCGAVPESLIESELFGYEKGAFTGAQLSGKQGLVELADNGTLFLDEIGDMPYDLQVKLLRLLQEKEFFRIGGTRPLKVNTRIIAATNQNLKEQIEKKRFREDLYYRLNVLNLQIPPLRERAEDIPILAETFRLKFNERYQLQKVLSHELINHLSQLQLRGNVRELENLIERLVLFSTEKVLTVNHLPGILEPEDPAALSCTMDVEHSTYQQLRDHFERTLLTEAKIRYQTTAEIGRQLKVDQSTISRKLKKYKID